MRPRWSRWPPSSFVRLGVAQVLARVEARSTSPGCASSKSRSRRPEWDSRSAQASVGWCTRRLPSVNGVSRSCDGGRTEPGRVHRPGFGAGLTTRRAARSDHRSPAEGRRCLLPDEREVRVRDILGSEGLLSRYLAQSPGGRGRRRAAADGLSSWRPVCSATALEGLWKRFSYISPCGAVPAGRRGNSVLSHIVFAIIFAPFRTCAKTPSLAKPTRGVIGAVTVVCVNALDPTWLSGLVIRAVPGRHG